MMKILLSPAKQMKEADDFVFPMSAPLFPEKTEKLLEHLSSLTYPELKAVFKTSDKVTQPIYDQYQRWKKTGTLPVYPAIFAYAGIAYQYMAPGVLSDEEIEWLQNHLLILSGLYGIVRPLDPVYIYRLEMHSRIPFSLYEFWGTIPAESIPAEDWILNLASAEYAKLIKKYRRTVDVRFEEKTERGWAEKGVYAKMARGRMVRYCAERKVEYVEDLFAFDDFGYVYDPARSREDLLVFSRDHQKDSVSS